MAKIEANGTTLNYLLEGPEDAPVVMFSNSLAATTAMWDDQAAALAGSYRVLRYDNRGHGGSPATEGPYSADLLEGDAIGLLDALGIDRVALFCGLSLGGALATGLGARHPGRVQKIMVCDIRDSMPPPAKEMWAKRLASLEEGGIAGVVDMTVATWFTPETVEGGGALIDKVRGMIKETDPKGYAGCFGVIGPLALLDHVPDISVPTLFVRGANDGGAPHDSMKAMHDALPGSELIEIPDAAHLANMEQPEAFNRIMLDFLQA